MSLLIFCSKLNKNLFINVSRHASHISKRWQSAESSVATSQAILSEHIEKAKYPEIFDITKKAEQTRKKIAWHEDVKNVKTIEEKLIKVNMPKYYGYQMMMMTEERLPYNCLPYVQHWTRTQYENGIPSSWNKQSSADNDFFVNEIKNLIEESLRFQHTECR